MKLVGAKLEAMLKIMEIITSSCSYMIIKDGTIRQLGNNKRCIFECDLKPLLEEGENLNLIIQNVNLFYSFIDLYCKQKDEVSIKKIRDIYTLIAGESETIIPNTLEKYANQTNTFLTTDELNERTKLNKRIMIGGGELSKKYSARIVHHAKNMSSQNLNITYTKEKIDLSLTMADKNSPVVAKITKFNNLEPEIIGTAQFTITPMVPCPDPMDLEFMVDNDKTNSFMKIHSKLCDNPNVDFTIWNVSTFKTDNMDEFDNMLK